MACPFTLDRFPIANVGGEGAEASRKAEGSARTEGETAPKDAAEPPGPAQAPGEVHGQERHGHRRGVVDDHRQPEDDAGDDQPRRHRGEQQDAHHRDQGPEAQQRAASLNSYGVKFHACKNTMDGLGWTDADLVDFAEVVPIGVEDIMLLQEKGFSYFSW